MNKKQYLLSICIPTYNGAERIRNTLVSIINAIGDRSNVEIIVSDNCSIDNTLDVVKSFSHIPYLRYYRNKTNIGFNGNIRILIDEYAVGQYCWLIGDDDVIDNDAILILLNIIEKYKPSYIALKHRCLPPQEINKFKYPSPRKLDIEKGTYFSCIDKIASVSNVLGTFMSSHIFIHKIVKEFDKSVFKPNNWEDFIYVFPNSYMMAQCFHNDINCICVNTPIITAIIHQKSWDNKLRYIKTKILPEGLNYYKGIAKCKSDLENSSNIIYNDYCAEMIKDLRHFKVSKILVKGLFSYNVYKIIIRKLYNRLCKKY